jgi:hypothetical protein
MPSWSLTVPRTGSAELRVEKTPRRVPETVPVKRNASGAFPAPATPFASARETTWDTLSPGRNRGAGRRTYVCENDTGVAGEPTLR